MDPRFKKDKSSKILIKQMYSLTHILLACLLASPKLNKRKTQVKMNVTLVNSSGLQDVAL